MPAFHLNHPKVQGAVVIDLAGFELDAEDRELLDHPQVGGVILFARNYSDPEQVTALIAAARAVRRDLWVAVDHEGGRVQRFKTGLTELPAMHRLARWHPDWLKPAAELAARELLALGIDSTFAPVLDRYNPASRVIGDRAFHESPRDITRLAGDWIAGLAAAGMGAIGKHFPGHGGVAADTHHEIAIDERSWPELAASDAEPFIQLASRLAGIMPAHVIFPECCDKPVSLSPHWLRERLRGQLQFEGAIVSDDLSMAAATAWGGSVAAAQMALEAGTDQVLVCNRRADAIALLEALESANFRLSDQALTRCQRLSAAPLRARGLPRLADIRADAALSHLSSRLADLAQRS
jgi:beta-N-acetylhexosaminidase